MKKFNKNIIVFILAFLFLGFGFSTDCFLSLRYCAIDFLVNNLPSKGLAAFDQFISDIDTYSKKLKYHDLLLDIDSLKHLCLNTQLVPKGHEVVTKCENDMLIVPYDRYPEHALNENVSAIQSLQVTAEENGAAFLYIAVPEKNVLYEPPANIVNHSNDNYSRYLDALHQKGIPTLDIYDALCKANMINENTFFKTDHHWTPETAFWATGKICSTLSEQYGFQYHEDYTNLDNYDLKVYPDWFLGAYGKKVGLYFTASGPDDITLITPKFETNLTRYKPIQDQEWTGPFLQSVLDMEQIQTKDYHRLSPYTVYGGGDFRLQIMKNNLAPEGKKILLLRDSYASPVAPFLALHAGELHIIDVRNFCPDEPVNVHDYIRQTDPDYVLVLYSGTGNPLNDYGRYILGNP